MLLAIVAALQLCSSYALEMVTPKDGEVFCAHKPEHSRFLALSREERRRQFLDKEWRARIVREDIASSPVPLRLEWKDGEGPYSVTIELGGNTVFETNTVATSVDVYNLEIAREYAWTVRSGGECVRGKFRTSDLPPRIIYLPDVRNIRDMGGWTGLGGRKIRQGMVYRSGGLNFNAHTYYNCEETLAFYKAGVLEERFGEIGRKVKMQIERDKGEFRFDPKAPFLRRSIIKEMHKGKERLTAEGLGIAKDVLKLKSDIDLRGSDECWGMTGSPAGDGVKWWHYPIHPYSRIADAGVKKNIAKVFEVFLEEKNYPIDFHCIGGADRAGSIAFILGAVLGMCDNDLDKDWDFTCFSYESQYFGHKNRFDRLRAVFNSYPGDTTRDKVEAYLKELGFTDADFGKLREILLEPENPKVNGCVSQGKEAIAQTEDPSLKTGDASVRLSSAGVAEECDIVVYGATSAGIAAAVQARRMGLDPIVIEPSSRIGGLTTGGLGQTDSGIKASFGGVAREFYKAIKAYYEKDSSWIFQKRSEYKPRGKTCWESGEDSMWTFEPSAARKVLDTWVRENRITIFCNERLDRTQDGVEKSGARIVSIRTESGRRFRAKMFLDCTYEGDLMAAAGVAYTIGREPNSKYGETINGIQRALMKNHQLNEGVDPYVRKGDPSSGLLPGIELDVDVPDGSGDSRVQAYCYRMCLTDDPRNRIPFEKPQGYCELDYELLLRNLEAGPLCPKHGGMPWINSPMPNRKTDTNNRTGFSTDFIGGADRWPEASYAEREEIALRHLKYQKGLMWTLANNPRVPERIRSEVARWGMCKDEFAGERGGGWQYQLYVREARRMVGEYVMTEHECRGNRVAPRPVALATYGMDSHNCRRYVTKKGFVLNEGNIEDYSRNPPGKPFERFQPYPIDYGAIVPKRGECSNLLVPVCVSASHIAFGSIRMEPVFFALGQSAATAASQAIADGCAVQDVDYGRLRERLLKDGQRLAIK